MNINLSVRLQHKEATLHKIRYARIDNTGTPVYTTPISINIPLNTPTSVVVAQNIPNGQYIIEDTPIYPDGRSVDPEVRYTDACSPLVSFNATLQNGNVVVSAVAPPGISKIRIFVDYPQGGSDSRVVVSNGGNITMALPVGLNGDFLVSGQSVCDEVTQFYSVRSNLVTVTRNSNPSITQVDNSDTGSGGTRTQIFVAGGVITGGSQFTLKAYSHPVTVVAVTGDTPSSLAIKLRDAINATTEGQWNDHGSAPASGTAGFKPTASALGSQLVVVLNYSDTFSANASAAL